jgi:hypothetical protein
VLRSAVPRRPSPSKAHLRYYGQVPTIHREGPYRFFFYSGDRHEPPHIHVERDPSEAKFWLERVELADNRGFGAAELRRIERIVIERASGFLRAWHEYFTD